MGDLFNFQVSDWRGALAGVLITLAGQFGFYLIKWGKRFRVLALAKTLWRPFIRSRQSTYVVLTTKPSSRPSGTPKASLSEVEAFHALQKSLSDFNIEAELIHKPGVHFSELNGHVVSIGGPESNNVTKEILAQIKSKYNVMPISYIDAASGIAVGDKRYCSALENDGSLRVDYGLIVRATGLIQGKPASSCLTAFGLRGLGTWGAVKALTANIEVMESIKKKVGDNDFVALLEFDFDGNELNQTRVIVAVALVSA